MDDPRRFPATQERRIALLVAKDTRQPTRKASFPALPPKLRLGDALGEFRLEREIASGGTATVYEAVELRLERRAALKVLSPHLSTVPAALSRFKAEAAFAERVEHPSIAVIYGSGKDREHYFYAMRLESGETAERISSDARTTDDEGFFHRAARLFGGVARALEALHEAGIVHRDVKPENLMLGHDGRLLLCDFGSALDSRERSPVLEETLWGTVRYMSPEQFGPGSDPYNPAMDIYALGLSLYEAVAGENPFPRVSDEEMARFKLTRVPPPPRMINPRLPLGLDAIIRQAIEPQRSQRYANAGELAEDLERFAQGKRGHRR